MNTRTSWRIRAIVALGVLVAVGSAYAQGKKTFDAGAIKTYDAPKVEKKKEKRGPADLEVPGLERDSSALAEDAREAQIIALQELIEMTDHSDPEKPELLLRMADLYWEKAEAFEGKANDLALETKIVEAQDAGRTAEADRYRRQQKAYLAKQHAWQDKAVDLYVEIEQGFPTFKRMDMVLYYLAYNLSTIDRGDEALQYYVRLASDYPDSRFIADALYNVGDYYFENNQFDNALVFYQKVANFPESMVFGFAMYKSAWCHYNMGDYDKAFEQFLAVVRYTDEMQAQGKKLPVKLKKEAQRDLVMTYSQVGTPGKALQFFKTVSPTGYLELGAQLAELYTDQGKFDSSSRLLKTIMKEDPDSHRVLTYQRIIVMNAEKRGVKDKTAKEAERLIGLYKKLQTSAPAEFLAVERKKLDMLLRVMATNYHSENEKTGDPEALVLARRLYGVYVEVFPGADDAYEMHRNYGVLLYQQKEYEKAVREFELVIEMRPEGKYTNEAAYTSLLCYYKLIKIGESAGKTEDDVDLTKKEIPELKQKMVKACDRYVRISNKLGAGEEDIPAAKYAAAKIFYDYNHFKAAIPRFKDIIRKHEHDGRAVPSAQLLLSSYNLVRDIRNLNKWADVLAGKPHLNKGDLAVIIGRIRDRAEYNKCFQYEHDKRFRRAADCFVAYTHKFPTTELMDKALYFAALNYDKAHEMEKAIETFVDLYNRQSSSPLAPKSLFAVGKVYHHAAVYSEASRYYEIYADKHPKDEFVEEALRFASLFRKSLGDYDQAISNLKTYLKRFPKSERAPHVYFDIGVILEKKRVWSKAIDHFNSYLRKYGKKGPLDLALLARLKIAKAYGKYKGKRQQAKSKQTYVKLVEYFNKLDEKRLAGVTPAVGVAAVAEARFVAGEEVLGRALKIRIKEDNIETAMTEKLQVIAEAKTIFEDVFSFEHPHWQIAALNRVGVAYADMADTIEKSPCPKVLNEEQCEIYQQDLAIKAEQIRASAVELFRKCLETAKDQKWFNRFSDDAEQRMAQIDYTYKFTKEFRARPTHTRTEAYPAGFLFVEDDEAEPGKGDK